MTVGRTSAFFLGALLVSMAVLVAAQSTPTDSTDAAILLEICNTLQPLGWAGNCSASSDACNVWKGTTSPAVACSSGGRLTQLRLANQNLTGTIPASIGDLTYLEYLTLTGNNLTGTLPAALSKLVYLKQMFISDNPQISGTIPASFGNFPALFALGLHSSNLTGTIPPELGNLAILNSLALHTNRLTGTIPATLTGLSKFYYFSVAFNDLSGTFPAAFSNINFNNFLVNDNPKLGGVWRSTSFNVVDPSRCNVSITAICQCNSTNFTCGSTWAGDVYYVPQCGVGNALQLYPWYNPSMCASSGPSTGSNPPGTNPSGNSGTTSISVNSSTLMILSAFIVSSLRRLL